MEFRASVKGKGEGSTVRSKTRERVKNMGLERSNNSLKVKVGREHDTPSRNKTRRKATHKE